MKILIALIFISIFFLPLIGIFRPEDIIIFSLPLILFLIEFPNISIPKKRKLFIILILVYLLWVLITIILNSTYTQITEIFELLKFLKALIIFLFFYKFFPTYSGYIAKIISICFFGLVIINLIHYFDLLGFNQYIAPFYISPERIEGITNIEIVKRMPGLMGDPNTNCMLFLFFTSFFFSKFVYNKTHLFSLCLSLLMIILCQSRTGFITLILMFLIFSLFFNKLQLKYLLYAAIIFILFIISIPLFDPIYYSYLTSMWEIPISENPSLLIRYEVWGYFLNILISSNHLLIGLANKLMIYDSQLAVDSMYVFIIFQYGLIGLFLFILILLYPITNSFKIKNEHSLALWIFFICIIIFSFTNAPFYEQRILCLSFFLAGAGFSSVDRSNNKQ